MTAFTASIGLLYHRVAEPAFDPFGLAVSPARFAEHLEVLRSVRVLPFAAFAEQAAAGTLPAGTVTITFDDGYRDNADVAAPALAARDLPATLFVLAGATGSGRPFWWDALAATVAAAPEGAPLAAAGRTVRPTGNRTACVLALWGALRRRPAAEITAALERLREEFGAGAAPDADALPCDQDTLLALAGSAPVTLGSHTLTHPSLGSHAAALQAREIAGGRTRLEELMGVPATSLAYPFGRPRIDVTRATVAAARDAGVTAACTVDDREIRGRCDPLRIRRWMVPNVDGATFEQLLHARLRGAGIVRRFAREARRAALDARDH